VAPRSADGVPILTDPQGERIRPSFFGVTAEPTLPPFVQFALSIGNPEITVLEAIYRAVGLAVADRLATLVESVVTLPEITLGETVVLSPKMWLVPARSVPAISTPVNASEFSSFHCWLAESCMPSRLAQAARPGEEPQWVDFGNPEGVNNFLRTLRSVAVVILRGSFLDRDEQGLASGSAWYEPEYYTELDGMRIKGGSLVCPADPFPAC
jgi:hypothetical protein